MQGLDPCIPIIAAVFPIAALALAEALKALDQFDFLDVFRHLIAELTFDPEPQGRAVALGRARLL